MYENFSDRARKVMSLANQEAARLKHECIGTEHILLGLVKEGSGTAVNVLKNLDVDVQVIWREVMKFVQTGSEIVVTGKLPQTPRAKQVIEYAKEEASNLNRNWVGTEHILLGLLREKDGVVGQVLMNLGLKLQTVREEVLNLLGRWMDISVKQEEAEMSLSTSDPSNTPELSEVQRMKEICVNAAGSEKVEQVLRAVVSEPRLVSRLDDFFRSVGKLVERQGIDGWQEIRQTAGRVAQELNSREVNLTHIIIALCHGGAGFSHLYLVDLVKKPYTEAMKYAEQHWFVAKKLKESGVVYGDRVVDLADFLHGLTVASNADRPWDTGDILLWVLRNAGKSEKALFDGIGIDESKREGLMWQLVDRE